MKFPNQFSIPPRRFNIVILYFYIKNCTSTKALYLFTTVSFYFIFIDKMFTLVSQLIVLPVSAFCSKDVFSCYVGLYLYISEILHDCFKPRYDLQFFWVSKPLQKNILHYVLVLIVQQLYAHYTIVCLYEVLYISRFITQPLSTSMSWY